MIDQKARDRWVQLMQNALRQCDFPADVSTVVGTFLGGVASFLINR